MQLKVGVGEEIFFFHWTENLIERRKKKQIKNICAFICFKLSSNLIHFWIVLKSEAECSGEYLKMNTYEVLNG